MEEIVELTNEAEGLYQNMDHKNAAKLYESSFCIACKHKTTPEWATVKAKILANISMCHMKAGNRVQAKERASECRSLQSTWFKGSFLLSMFSETTEEAAKLLNETLQNLLACVNSKESYDTLLYLIWLQLRIAHHDNTIKYFNAALSMIGWHWKEIFVHFARREDWPSIDMLLSLMDTHQLQADLLHGSIVPPTPRDDLGQISHRAIDAAVHHCMLTGHAVRLYTMLRRFQSSLDFTYQVHDQDGNTPLHLVAKGACSSVDRAYLLQLLISHGFCLNSSNRSGQQPKDLLLEGSLAHRICAWQSDREKSLLKEMALLSDEAVQHYLLSIVCCQEALDLPSLLLAIPCLTTEDQQSISDALKQHGKNTAWKRLLDTLYRGEEFGLVQLSVAVFKTNVELAKTINRVYQRLCLRGVYSDCAMSRAIRKHWSEMIWAISQSFTQIIQSHFDERSQLHKWFKQFMTIEGAFLASIVMVQYIERWQKREAISDLLNLLAEEDYEDLRDTVSDSIEIFESEERDVEEVDLRVLENTPWPELESFTSEISLHGKSRGKHKSNSRRSQSNSLKAESLKSYEEEVVKQIPLMGHSLVLMPHRGSEMAVWSALIGRHLRAECHEPTVNGEGEEYEKRVLLVLASKKDVSTGTEELKHYLPQQKILEHGVQSQKMGLLRSMQTCPVVVCGADALHHALQARSFSLQVLSLLLFLVPPSEIYTSSNYYSSILRQIGKLSSSLSATSSDSTSMSDETMSQSPCVVIMTSSLKSLESAMTLEQQVNKITKNCCVSNLIHVKKLRQDLVQDILPSCSYEFKDFIQSYKMEILNRITQGASETFGSQGELVGLAIIHSQSLQTISEEEITEAIKTKMPGKLETIHINGAFDFQRKKAKNSIHFMIVDADDDVLDKVQDEQSFAIFNFMLLHFQDEWHLLCCHNHLWRVLYDIAFEKWFSKQLRNL